MRIVLILALLANSLDLVATTLGIHWLGNREGNPLLAILAQQNWLIFVLVKGFLVPLLIVRLYCLRAHSPVIASAGMAVVLVALTLAVGQWLGWIAGVIHVAALARL
jgi:uncharacterized membrane protein